MCGLNPPEMNARQSVSNTRREAARDGRRGRAAATGCLSRVQVTPLGQQLLKTYSSIKYISCLDT